MEWMERGRCQYAFQSSELAGLSVDGVRKVKLKWAFGFDGDVTAFARSTVLDGHVFVGSACWRPASRETCC